MISLLINTTASDGTNFFWPWFMWLLGAFILGIILGWILKQIFGGKAHEEVSEEPPVDVVKDDLTKIEGIGPKIQEILNNDGIWSFKQLSNVSVKRLKNLLEMQGPSFKVHNPITWSAQARLADEGLWEELEVWQERLIGGL